MTDPALLGATEEIVAALVEAGGTCEAPPPKRGRPRIHADNATKHRAFRARKKACEATHDEIPAAPATRDEIPTISATDMDKTSHLHERLDEVAGGLFDPNADLEPIVALIRDQGCLLEGDVLPVAARLLRDLPRPLKNWGAPWLAREILAACDRRLGRRETYEIVDAPDSPSPPRQGSSIPWDDFVAGYREGRSIIWRTASRS
jgi:hypothetical protein